MNRHTGQTAVPSASTAVVVLAAGAGARFCVDALHDEEGRDENGRDENGRVDTPAPHKLLATLPATADRPAETVAARSIANAIAADLGDVIVVTGAVDLDLADRVVRRHNPDWERGQMTSVLAGIAEAASRGHQRVVFGLADQPGIEPAAWRAVAEYDGPIAVATYDGRRGNPVRLDEEVWNLLPAGGDEGARVLMRDHPNLVREVPCTGSPADIDTVEDLRQWQSS
jgi:molybdenum cofactor cytidylyltransferase